MLFLAGAESPVAAADLGIGRLAALDKAALVRKAAMNRLGACGNRARPRSRQRGLCSRMFKPWAIRGRRGRLREADETIVEAEDADAVAEQGAVAEGAEGAEGAGRAGDTDVTVRTMVSPRSADGRAAAAVLARARPVFRGDIRARGRAPSRSRIPGGGVCAPALARAAALEEVLKLLVSDGRVPADGAVIKALWAQAGDRASHEASRAAALTVLSMLAARTPEIIRRVRRAGPGRRARRERRLARRFSRAPGPGATPGPPSPSACAPPR